MNVLHLEKQALQFRNRQLEFLTIGVILSLPLALWLAVVMGSALLQGNWVASLIVFPLFLLGAGFCWRLTSGMVPQIRHLNLLIKERKFQEVMDYKASLRSNDD